MRTRREWRRKMTRRRDTDEEDAEKPRDELDAADGDDASMAVDAREVAPGVEEDVVARDVVARDVEKGDEDSSRLEKGEDSNRSLPHFRSSLKKDRLISVLSRSWKGANECWIRPSLLYAKTLMRTNYRGDDLAEPIRSQASPCTPASSVVR